jgi:DNA-binding transcriptional MocR family regulator
VRGARLPAERVLATRLAVSRGTAVAAYDLLVADGLVERRRGSGTFVSGPEGPDGPEFPADRDGSTLVHRIVDRSAPPAAATRARWPAEAAGAQSPARGPIDLSLSVLADAGALADVSVSTADLAAVAPGTGYSPWGLPGLRHALAGVLAGWGLDATAEQIVVTTGAQQALSLAAACWLRPGDTVVVEDPTYPGAVAAFRQAGARLIGVPVDRDGVEVDALAAAVARRPALVYLQSGVHSPTGTVLSEPRRRQVADLIRRSRVPLVEDLALAGLAWAPPPPPIAALCPGASVAVVGSLSKMLWGGLRVGWVRAPAPLALRLARIKATSDLGSSVVGQVLAERLLASLDPPHVSPHLAELRHRYQVLADALHIRLPGWAWAEPAGGLSLWVRLPLPVAARLAATARGLGVVVATTDEGLSAGAGRSAVPAHPDRIRLSFALPEPALTAGVDRLAQAWHLLDG